MSLLADTLATVRRIVLLDADVQQLKTRADAADDRLADHRDRLVRIETIIEMARTPRLPRE
jgi:hypothetical protein